MLGLVLNYDDNGGTMFVSMDGYNQSTQWHSEFFWES